jgi:hypothetical protein
VVDAGPLADSWRQATGTPVWGTPYGPYSNENGQSAGEDAIPRGTSHGNAVTVSLRAAPSSRRRSRR